MLPCASVPQMGFPCCLLGFVALDVREGGDDEPRQMEGKPVRAKGLSCLRQQANQASTGTSLQDTQGAQYGLIKEYGSNYIGIHNMI